MKGFFGKLLRINLKDKSYTAEEIPEQTLRRYLGGKGLGSHLLLNNVPAGTDPLAPENRLIFTTGPATATIVPGSSRYGIYSKSPLTGLYAESYAGGKAAPAMRCTGYDAIIVEGASALPVFLEISDWFKAFPTRYWSEGFYDKWQEICGDAHQQRYQVKSRSCPKCYLACSKDTVVTEGFSTSRSTMEKT